MERVLLYELKECVMLAVLFLFSLVGAPKAVFVDGKHQSRQMEPWAAPAGWQRGSCPLCPMPCPPVDRREKKNIPFPSIVAA